MKPTPRRISGPATAWQKIGKPDTRSDLTRRTACWPSLFKHSRDQRRYAPVPSTSPPHRLNFFTSPQCTMGRRLVPRVPRGLANRLRDIFGRATPACYTPSYVEHINRVSLRPGAHHPCPCGSEGCRYARYRLTYTMKNAGRVQICVSLVPRTRGPY